MIYIIFVGILPVNTIPTPLHYTINTCNHILHGGYHYNSRLKLPDKRIPPRGPGTKRTEAENKAIKESTEEFKYAIRYGPAKLPADLPDPTGSMFSVS